MSFCKTCNHGVGIRLEFSRGNAEVQEVDLNTIRAKLVAAMNMTDGNEFVPTFMRGDRCTIPHVANDIDMLGDSDYHHVRMNANQLNRLRQMDVIGSNSRSVLETRIYRNHHKWVGG